MQRASPSTGPKPRTRSQHQRHQNLPVGDGASSGAAELAAICQGMRLDTATVRKLKTLLASVAAEPDDRASGTTTGSTRSGRSCASDSLSQGRKKVDATLEMGESPSCATPELQRLRAAEAALAAEEEQLGRTKRAVHADIDEKLGALGRELRQRRAAIEAEIAIASQRQRQQPPPTRRPEAPPERQGRQHREGCHRQRQLQHQNQHHQRRRHHRSVSSEAGGGRSDPQPARSQLSSPAPASLVPYAPRIGQQLQQLRDGLRDLLGSVVCTGETTRTEPKFGQISATIRTGGRPLGACACLDTSGFSCRPSRLLAERRPPGGSWRPLPSPCLFVHFAIADAGVEEEAEDDDDTELEEAEKAESQNEEEVDEEDEDDEGEEGEADIYAMSFSGERLARIRFGACVRRVRVHGQSLFVATGDGRVLECDLAGKRLRALDGLLRPAGLCSDVRSLFVYEAGRSRVAVYDRTGGLRLAGIVQLRASDRRLPGCAGGLTVLGDWLLLVDSRARPCERCRAPGRTARRLLVFDRAGNRVVATLPRDSTQGYCLHEPCGLAADQKRGLVYVSDRCKSCVLALAAPSGQLIARLGQRRLAAPCSLDLLEMADREDREEGADAGADQGSEMRQLLLVCDTRRGRLLALDLTRPPKSPSPSPERSPSASSVSGQQQQQQQQLQQQLQQRQRQPTSALTEALSRTLQLLSEAK